jgi:hypothetical protein
LATLVPGDPSSSSSPRGGVFSLFFCFLDNVVVVVCCLLSPQKSRKSSPQFFYFEREKSFEKKITRELTTMKRCRKVVVLHSFVACVVSALVFARPARGFYLPGVAPQGTPRCCFCAKASRATWFLECLSLRVIESEFSFVEKDARCLTSFLSLSLFLSQITRKTMSCS